MKYYLIAGAVIALIAGSIYAGYSWGSNKTAVKYMTEIKAIHDTSYVETTKWLQTPSKIDTIPAGFILLHDTVKVPLKIARADSVTTKDSSVIKVSYYFPPVNKFDIVATIKQHIKVITETKNVEIPVTLWNRFGAGIQSGLGYGIFHKKLDCYVGVGFYFKIF